MYLKKLIKYLESKDREYVCAVGFNNPHSYRGYYDELAFEPAENVTVGEMLDCAKESVGKIFQGYKGGDFVMNKYTTVWLAKYSKCGEAIGKTLLGYMTGSIINK